MALAPASASAGRGGPRRRRDGALGGISAARDAGVARVVLTSSYSAVGYILKPDDHCSEAEWTDPGTEGLPAHHKPKVPAERAAWNYVRAHGDIELTVIDPTGIFGPQPSGRPSTSVGLVRRMLAGQMPVVPIMCFGVVDVRNVVDLHLRVMVHPKAAGERFPAVGGPVSLFAMAQILREHIPSAADLLPSVEQVRGTAKTRPALPDAAALQGRIPVISNERARSVLGWEPRDAREAVLATGTAPPRRPRPRAARPSSRPPSTTHGARSRAPHTRRPRARTARSGWASTCPDRGGAVLPTPVAGGRPRARGWLRSVQLVDGLRRGLLEGCHRRVGEVAQL
ncbi:NAD-dependent epimerase/dehydratase family protein [Streptomyces olivaceus]|uniref:NAD-dependent epimerase/dehydratase family protein n=1 Tax=Streptomyces olivaceus TaxID=47716 RepID=UPI0033BEBB09